MLDFLRQSSFFFPIFPASTLVHTCTVASQVLCGDDGTVAGECCGVLGNLLAGKLGYVLNFVIFAGLDSWEKGAARMHWRNLGNNKVPCLHHFVLFTDLQ